ncbi:MAG: hypothetical protein IJI87_09240 [Mogibacterium sp.]|nr:hypothetical protein [Mogibacterium sp.]MBQ6623452.1 hypothetical protein [Mogibacterium sp.]
MFINQDTYEVTAEPTDNHFEVDDLIAPAIAVLNQKGYKTAFCCSGHSDCLHNPELAYIAFEFGGITPETLPHGWQWVCDGQMEYEYEEVSLEIIAAVMTDLLAWAEALPDTTF